MEKASNTNAKALFTKHFVQKIIIVALLLFATHTTLLAQLPERLIPMNVTALEAVDVTKLSKSDNPWDHWDKPDTTIRFTACKGDTSVIGYVMEDNIGIPFLLHFVHSDSAKSYHPTLGDVQRAEVIFAEVLNLRTDSANQVPRVFLAPYFYQYIRQYIFYLNKQNDTCVYINLVQFQRAKEYGVDRRFIHVCDGDDYYWRAKINLTKRQLLDYSINGPTVHVSRGRNSEPEGLVKAVRKKYEKYKLTSFNYREYPKAVERQLPAKHDSSGVTRVTIYSKGLRKYYRVFFGDGVTLTYRSNGKLISVATDDDVAGLSNEDLSLFPGADTLVNAIERDMRAIGRDFRKNGTIMWIEKIKGCYVIAASYESPTPIYGMVAYYTFDRKGQISGVLRRWSRY
jgi:hypothetical protein